MMPRRAHRAEGVIGNTGHDRIDRGDDRAGGAQGRLSRGRRQDRIGIDADMAGSRNGVQHALDMVARVNTNEIVECCFRRLAALQPGKFRALERIEHGLQPRRRFRMVPTGIVFETGRMRIEQRRHRETFPLEQPSVAHWLAHQPTGHSQKPPPTRGG